MCFFFLTVMTTTFGNKGTKSDRHVHVSYTICICNHAQCVHVSYTICTCIIYNMYRYHIQYVHVSYTICTCIIYTICICNIHNMDMYHAQYVHVSYSITNKCVFFLTVRLLEIRAPSRTGKPLSKWTPYSSIMQLKL